jgi:hypothetical protein
LHPLYRIPFLPSSSFQVYKHSLFSLLFYSSSLMHSV